MTFLTIFEVTEILCSFRLVIEGKTGTEIPESSRLEFSEKFQANNSNLSDAKDNTSRPLNRGSIADLPLFSNLWEVQGMRFLAKDGLFCFIIICNFGSFKNPFSLIAIMSEFYFRFRRFFLLVQTKEVISTNHGSSISCWKPMRGLRFDMLLTMQDIDINFNLSLLTKFTSSSRGTAFKHLTKEHLSNDHKGHPNLPENSHKLCDKMGVSHCERDGEPMVTETTTWLEFLNRGKAIVEQILGSEEIINP